MKFLVVDDHVLFRRGILHILQDVDKLLDLIECDNLAGALSTLGEHPDTDLVLLDLTLGDASGTHGLRMIRHQFPQTSVVVLSAEESGDVISRCMNIGAKGYIPKTSTPEELHAAIGKITAGEVYLPSGFSGSGFSTRPRSSRGNGAIAEEENILGTLSSRQRDVLYYLLQGKPNKTISACLSISENTVKAHLSAIFLILGARNRTEAVYLATRAGINFDLESPPVVNALSGSKETAHTSSK